jgi:tetratricopeptide (TPR) repeat protein
VMRAQAPGRTKLRPRRREEKERRLCTPLGERAHEVDRARVGPLQVLEGEHDGLRPRPGHEPGDDRRQLPSPQVFRRKGRLAPTTKRDIDEGGQQGRSLVGVDLDLPQDGLELREALLSRHVRAAETLPAPFRDRMKRRVLQELRGAPFDPGVRRFGEPCSELLDQPRLAEARLAHDHNELAIARPRELPTAGEQAQVTAQLIDALSGRLLWFESYNGDLKDLFEVRNQITQNVVGKLAIKLKDIERRSALKKPTDSLDAYDYVLRGRESYARNTRSANTDARRMFERAIQLDPAYASAYAALGSTRLNAAVSGWTEFRDEALRDAENMAQKAIELDADNAEAHRLLGRIYFNRVQFDLANAEHGRAIALNPNDAESYDALGEILVTTGHPKEALESFDTAKRLNPGAGDRLVNVGWAYYLQQRYEEAITAFAAGARAFPDDYGGYSGLAAAYAQLDRKDEAAHAADNLRRVWPFFQVSKFVEQFQGEDYRALMAEGMHKAGLK